MFHGGGQSIHRVSHGGVCEFSIRKYFINLKIQFPQNKRLPKIRKYLHILKRKMKNICFYSQLIGKLMLMELSFIS